MIRIRGRVGDLPIDLEIEGLETLLGGSTEPSAEPGVASVPITPSTSAPPAGPLLQPLLQALASEGAQSGTMLIDLLRALNASDGEIKRTMTQLRNRRGVKVQAQGEGWVYRLESE